MVWRTHTIPIFSHLKLWTFWGTVSIAIIAAVSFHTDASSIEKYFQSLACSYTIFACFIPVSSLWAVDWPAYSKITFIKSRNTLTLPSLISKLQRRTFHNTCTISTAFVILMALTSSVEINFKVLLAIRNTLPSYLIKVIVSPTRRDTYSVHHHVILMAIALVCHRIIIRIIRALHARITNQIISLPAYTVSVNSDLILSTNRPADPVNKLFPWQTVTILGNRVISLPIWTSAAFSLNIVVTILADASKRTINLILLANIIAFLSDLIILTSIRATLTVSVYNMISLVAEASPIRIIAVNRTKRLTCSSFVIIILRFKTYRASTLNQIEVFKANTSLSIIIFIFIAFGNAVSIRTSFKTFRTVNWNTSPIFLAGAHWAAWPAQPIEK